MVGKPLVVEIGSPGSGQVNEADAVPRSRPSSASLDAGTRASSSGRPGWAAQPGRPPAAHWSRHAVSSKLLWPVARAHLEIEAFEQR